MTFISTFGNWIKNLSGPVVAAIVATLFAVTVGFGAWGLFTVANNTSATTSLVKELSNYITSGKSQTAKDSKQGDIIIARVERQLTSLLGQASAEHYFICAVVDLAKPKLPKVELGNLGCLGTGGK